MTFKFIQEYKDFNDQLVQRVTFELPQDSNLMQVIEGFEHFLKGAGYQLDGYLDIVPNDEDVQPEPEEDPHWYKNNLESTMYDEQDVMPMPGTMGGAKVMFGDDIKPVTSIDEKCKICGLTRRQLGDHSCYDQRCGFK